MPSLFSMFLCAFMLAPLASIWRLLRAGSPPDSASWILKNAFLTFHLSSLSRAPSLSSSWPPLPRPLFLRPQDPYPPQFLAAISLPPHRNFIAPQSLTSAAALRTSDISSLGPSPPPFLSERPFICGKTCRPSAVAHLQFRPPLPAVS